MDLLRRILDQYETDIIDVISPRYPVFKQYLEMNRKYFFLVGEQVGISSIHDDHLLTGPFQKTQAFFSRLKTSGQDGFDCIVEFLSDAHPDLAYRLREEYMTQQEETSSTGTAAYPSQSVADPTAPVENLRKCLIAEYMHRFSHLQILQSDDKRPIDSIYVTLKLRKSDQEQVEFALERLENRDIIDYSKLLNPLLGGTENVRKPDIAKPMIILGDAGQGKTTFLQKLAYDWAMGRKKGIDVSLLFFISLRNVSESTDNLLDLVLGTGASAFPGRTVIAEWIKINFTQVLFLLDGLDEIPNNNICKELREVLTRRFPVRCSPPFPIIITSLPYAIPPGCPWDLHFKICELDTEQVEQCIEKFACHATNEFKKKLSTFARENSFVRSSSLLLHLFCKCAVLSNTFPKTQTQIYFKIATQLEERRNKKKGTRETTPQDTPQDMPTYLKCELVKRLALFAFAKTCSAKNEFAFNNSEVDEFLDKSPTPNATEQKQGVYTADAKEIGYFVTNASFVLSFELGPPPSPKLSFAHETFQEFFAAIYIVIKIVNDEELQTMLRKANWNFLERNAQVFIFATGIASAANLDALKLLLMCLFQCLCKIKSEVETGAGEVARAKAWAWPEEVAWKVARLWAGARAMARDVAAAATEAAIGAVAGSGLVEGAGEVRGVGEVAAAAREATAGAVVGSGLVEGAEEVARAGVEIGAVDTKDLQIRMRKFVNALNSEIHSVRGKAVFNEFSWNTL